MNNQNNSDLVIAELVDEEADSRRALAGIVQATAVVLVEPGDAEQYSVGDYDSKQKQIEKQYKRHNNAQCAMLWTIAVMTVITVVVVVSTVAVVTGGGSDDTGNEESSPTVMITMTPTFEPTVAPTALPTTFATIVGNACSIREVIPDFMTRNSLADDFARINDLAEFDEQNEIITCTGNGIINSNTPCGSSPSGFITISNCDHVVCTGRGACLNSTITGSNSIECDGLNSCNELSVSNLKGDNPTITCGGAGCVGITVTTELSANSDERIKNPKLTCGQLDCGSIKVDFGINQGTVICTGARRDPACYNSDINAKCLVCMEEEGLEWLGCDFGSLRFQGGSINASTNGYCGDCADVPEANGLPNLC